MTGTGGILITCAHWIHLFSLEYHGLGFVYFWFFIKKDSFRVIRAMQLKSSSMAINYIHVLLQNTAQGTGFFLSQENNNN